MKINKIKELQWSQYFRETSIKTKWLYIRRLLFRQFNIRVPHQLWIGVTYQCQCDCIHCFLGPQLNKKMGKLTQIGIYNLIEEAQKLGFMEICFFGGEPLLREDLVDLVRFTSKKGLLSTIFTNGILLNREMAEKLAEAGLSFCNVSLDSSTPEKHDSLRRFEGCFEKAVAGIQYLVDYGVKTSIWTYPNKQDVRQGGLRDIKALMELGQRLKIWKSVVLFPIASGNWLCGSDYILTKDERNNVRKLLMEYPIAMLEFPSEDAKCRAGNLMVYIDVKGDIFPCPCIPLALGNVKKEPLLEIIKNMNKNFVSNLSDKCGECVMNTASFRETLGLDKGPN